MNRDTRKTLTYINRGKLCFGCGACVAACPKACIVMEPDSEGFSYPRIDFSACVKCGNCIRKCPVNSTVEANGEPEFFSVRHRDVGVRKASTSGGAFTALSDVVLAHDGVVTGAVWGENFKVRHGIAADARGRDAMRYSKYVQSDSTGIFKPVADALRSGWQVLFSGTPCQVAALYSFLGDKPENLFTVDFICHGAPSPRVFQSYLRYLEEQRNGSKVVAVRFRDQHLGCVPMRMGVDFADGSVYSADCDHDLYFRLFLSGVANRQCCAHCPYTHVRRGSDVTIADNWRFQAFAPEWDDNTGVSALLVNTCKGRALFDEAGDALEIRACRLEDVDQYYLHRPGGVHPDRALFFRALRRRGFAAAAVDFTRPRPLLRRLRSRLLKILGVGGRA